MKLPNTKLLTRLVFGLAAAIFAILLAAVVVLSQLYVRAGNEANARTKVAAEQAVAAKLQSESNGRLIQRLTDVLDSSAGRTATAVNELELGQVCLGLRIQKMFPPACEDINAKETALAEGTFQQAPPPEHPAPPPAVKPQPPQPVPSPTATTTSTTTTTVPPQPCTVGLLGLCIIH